MEELYQRYLADPGSVDRAWWSFFADYQPTLPSGTGPQPVLGLAGAPRAPVPQAAPPRSPAPSVPQSPPGAQAPPAPSATPAPAASRAPAPAPAAPAPPAPVPAAPAAPAAPPPSSPGTEVSRLRGAAARTVTNMTASLAVPTATSVRAVPAKLLVDNRIVINNHLRRGRGGKVSFTHLIGYAVVTALVAMPEMNDSYTEENGKPAIAKPDHVNLGLAIDVHSADGGRQLLVPNIKAAEEMDFRQFWTTYEDVVRRARSGKLAVTDFQGTTATITNPGTIGTEHSVPRLMAGQG
ncbi:MAG TPA: 2-oxo acid dehydrogenase subunit E2, partial [Streptosporangiaceae bacterium]|nr:2-oxo acid dehydrogenase subunit E2 [Streptosporangiaceae bacterium]